MSTKPTADPTLFNASNTEERKTTKVYDAAGNVTSEKRKGYADADREVRSLYNPTTGTLTSTTVVNGTTDIVTQFLYDARGLPTQVTDPDNGVSNTAYDQLGHATNALAPTVPNETGGATPVSSRPETRTGYNAFGETTHERDARGNVTTHTFDEQGRETLVTFPTYTPPGGTAMTPTQSSTYDLVGNLITSVDRRGKTSSFSFDKLNRNYKAVTPGSAPGSTVTTSTFFDRVGNKVRTIDPTGAVTRFTYDMANRTRTQTTELREVGVPLPKMLTSTFDYDSVGNQTWAKDPLGKLTTKTFNGAGQQLTVTDPLFHTSSVTINGFGETVKTTDATNIQTVAEFDQAGRQTKTINKGTGGTQPALTTVMTYNGRGMRTSTTSPEGHPTVVEWDAAGRMKKVTVGSGADSASTELFYDAAGNNTRVRDARGNAASSSAFDTILNYQSWNLLESRVEPPAPAGQPAANRTWTTSYDGAGLVTKEQQPGSVVLNRTYDDAGRPLTESATGATGSRTYAYDNNGRPTSISHPTSAITVTYDDRGLPRTINGGGGLTQYKWDDNGRLDLRTDPAGTADLSYDDAGRLIGETDPITGGSAEYGYDNAGRRVYVASNGPGGVPANTPVRWTGYDDYGRTSWDVLPDINGGGDEYARAYQYDNDGNQTSTMVWGNSNPADNGFQYGSYNTRGELASWTDTAGATTNYTYDKAGNRTGVGATTYAYDAQNRLTSGGGATYTWTDRGTLASVTSGGTTTNSTFDVYGQALTNGTVTMTYDGLGRIATRNGTAFTYSGQSLDPVSDGAWVTNHSVDGTVLSTKQVGGANARWAVVDSHRNVAGLRNPATGLVDNSTNFNPFGVKTSTTGSLSATVGFQGDYTDPTTAEVWMGARHYRPTTATFTSRDSYGGRLDTPVSLNRYTYAYNNPLNNWDPDGHRPAEDDRDIFQRNLNKLLDIDTMNQALWFHTIAENNGQLAGWDTWWAAYFEHVITPDHKTKREAAMLTYDQQHPRSSFTETPKAVRQEGRPIQFSNRLPDSANRDLLEDMFGSTDGAKRFMTYVAKYAAEAGIDFRSLFGVVMVETSGRSWWERIGNPLCEPAPCDSTGPSNLHPDVFTETVDAHPSLRGLYPKDFLPDWSNKARDEAVWASLSGSEFLEIAIATTAYRLKDLEGIAYVLMGEGKREGYDVSDAVPVSDLAIGMYLGEDKTNPAKSAFPNNRGKGTVKTKGTLEGVPKGYLKLVQGFYGAAEELFCSRGSGFTCTGL